MLPRSQGFAAGCVSYQWQPQPDISTEHMINLKLVIAKNNSMIYFSALPIKKQLFLPAQGNIPHHRIIIQPQNNVCV